MININRYSIRIFNVDNDVISMKVKAYSLTDAWNTVSMALTDSDYIRVEISHLGSVPAIPSTQNTNPKSFNS